MKLGPYEALLFDMDGTLLTSIAAVARAWTAWARRIGADPVAVGNFIHGRTARDTIAQFLPEGRDLETELAWLDALELADVDGIAAIPGAGALLRALPDNRWALVTSASLALVKVRMGAAGLPLPKVLVAIDDVARGKPDPEGYLRAATLLKADPARCLVFEDTGTGMTAGRAAGAEVVRIAGDHDATAMTDALTLASYEGVAVEVGRGAVTLDLAGA